LSVVVRAAVLGRLDTFAVGTRTLERVTVASGDVIFADDRIVIAVAVSADDVLIMRPKSIGSAIGIAHALGNRHLPIQTDGESIIVRYDPLLEALAAEHGVPVTREPRVIGQPFRHAHAPHRHD
jgi:urease accessory protein